MLSKQDEQRAMVLGQVGVGLLGMTEAATLIGVGERQVRRLLAAYQGEGPRGIVHGNRGRAPAHATSPELRTQVIALSTGKYEAVNHSHLAELLSEREELHVSRSTLGRLLAAAGVRSPRPQRRGSKHRSRRERYPQEGMLLQIDASHHHWFGQEIPTIEQGERLSPGLPRSLLPALPSRRRNTRACIPATPQGFPRRRCPLLPA